MKIPEDHFAACAALDPPMAVEGNAAGNAVQLLNMTGEPTQPGPLPSGFTPRGIVALTFSIVAGLLGIGVVTWYGLGEMNTIETEKQHERVDKLVAERGVLGGEPAKPISASTPAAAGTTGAAAVAEGTDPNVAAPVVNVTETATTPMEETK